ncbi:response regulator [Treponema sp. UBA6852]|uniref:response regulator n=2 Tax=unclassified Treponema TaxID=2638727 RepID=UPI0025CCD1CC|nr:response regulator [Treponema sp. UBA6852]
MQVYYWQSSDSEFSSDFAFPSECKKSGFRFSPGFVKGTLWCAVQRKNPQKFPAQILDLGPEIVDSVELYVFENGSWKKSSVAGRTVFNSQKPIKSWRVFLEIPEGHFFDECYILKIKNSDSTSCIFRFFTMERFFEQTEHFSFVHIIFFCVMLVTAAALFVLFASLKEKLFLYLGIMTFAFFLYQLAMKGFGCTYIWNAFCQKLFFVRFGYIVCAIGLCFSQILFLENLSLEKNWLCKRILGLILFVCLVSVFLYGFCDDVKVPYIATICFLILGCAFCSALLVHSFFKIKNIPSLLIFSWVPLFVYIIFRQSLHLLRLKFNVNFLSVFDNDYYFGYDICFVSHILIYGVSIFVKVRQRQNEFNMLRESSYFLKSSAHELLAPVTIIQNSVEEMENIVNEFFRQNNFRGGGALKNFFACVKSTDWNIQRIKNIALMVNSLERQEQNIQEAAKIKSAVFVMNLFRQCLDNFISYARIKGIEISWTYSCGEELCVLIFPLFLETVFINLIDNAIKYSVEKNKIDVSIEWDTLSKTLVYRVSNFSENILEQNIEQLFAFGFRGKNISENIAGMGIGLNLVRRICKLYNGNCNAVCVPVFKDGKNLHKVVFEARLPLEIVSGSTDENYVQKTEQLFYENEPELNISALQNYDFLQIMQGVKILCAEDNLSLLENIQNMFKPYCTVFAACNGKDALEKIKKEIPDLIISDMVMPVMDGKAFFEICRKDENLKTIPFLFLTGVQDSKLRRVSIKEGAVDYIFKPFSQMELLLKVYSVLSLKINVKKDFARTITDFINKTAESSYGGKLNSDLTFVPAVDSRENRICAYKKFGLSSREIEIAELLLKNQTNKQIAKELFIATSTVATHIQHIYEKFGVKNRTEWIQAVMSL